MGFNGSYLLDALKAYDAKRVRMLVTDDVNEHGTVLKPVLIGDDILQMPMRSPG